MYMVFFERKLYLHTVEYKVGMVIECHSQALPIAILVLESHTSTYST